MISLKSTYLTNMRKISVLALSLMVFFSCKKEDKLSFTEDNILYEDNAVIEINIPKANNTTVGNSLNTLISNHIANALNFGEDDAKKLPLDDAIKKFQDEYDVFKTDYEESALVWEATFDGEIIYHTDDIISIALSHYINTGGAHGNSNITLYNINTQTGENITNEELIKNMSGLTDLVKTYFAKEIEIDSDEGFEDYFFGDDFHLPANIGFNDEGLLILYNVYEIASYAQGITEFTIPLDEAKPFLSIY